MSMQVDLRSRFGSVLNPHETDFNPLPVAACLLDPQLAPVILSPELQPLLNAAKRCIVSLSSEQTLSPVNEGTQESNQTKALSRLAFLQ